ncbi:uncharacterized protein PG986_002250 [Apiospora aurea]|uniref:Uncharacterized protein n=1 Tax=Apiospora aurea TaxID=335848 RepID=A0ABR1QZ92_9PEZI
MEEEANDGSDHSSSTSLSEEALAALQQDDVADGREGGSRLLMERYLKLHKAHNKLHESHNEFENGTNQRLNKFERRLNKVAISAASSSGAPSTASELSDLEDDYQLGYEENTIPETRDVNFEQFKNRYGDDDWKNCIEVLVAGSDFEEQIRQELKRRDELDEDDHKRRPNFEESDDAIIQRVRVQSPALLFLLCETMQHSDVQWKGQNRTTFYRPFSSFVYRHDKMKDELKKLEEHWSRCSSPKDIQNETVAETVARLKPSISGVAANEAASASEAKGGCPQSIRCGTESKE